MLPSQVVLHFALSGSYVSVRESCSLPVQAVRWPQDPWEYAPPSPSHAAGFHPTQPPTLGAGPVAGLATRAVAASIVTAALAAHPTRRLYLSGAPRHIFLIAWPVTVRTSLSTCFCSTCLHSCLLFALHANSR